LQQQIHSQCMEGFQFLFISLGRSPCREENVHPALGFERAQNLQAVILVANLLQLLASGVRGEELGDSLGLCVFARSTAAAGYDLVVRAFPAGVGIVEDPASGAANGLIAAWIAQSEPHGALARGYRVSQGREIGRDASILIVIEGREVWVGGRTHTIIDGSAAWPG